MSSKRTALITGSATGIGAQTAVMLAQNGFNIALNCRDISKAELCRQTVSKCRSFGAECKCFAADVSVYEQCRTMVSAVLEHFGTVDVLVNNAGKTMLGSLIQTSHEKYTNMLAANQYSTYYMMQLCAKPMCAANYGRIINISSYTGIYGGQGVFAYSAAKGAVAAMTKSAAKELAQYGITVNAVAPGMIETDMLTGHTAEEKKRFEEQRTAFEKNAYCGRLGKPSEVASAIAYLASEDAAYITGQVIEISGGILK